MLGEGGRARGTQSYSGLGAYLQVPVYNVFLVTVVHGRYNLGGRRFVTCGPKWTASLSGL